MVPPSVLRSPSTGSLLALDGHHVMGVEAAVGAHRELAPPWRTRPTVSRKWAAPRAVLARPFRSLAISRCQTARSGW